MRDVLLAALAPCRRDRLCADGDLASRPGQPFFLLLAALAIATSGGIGVFHAGVEYGWWEGLTACATTGTGGSTQDVMDAIMATPLVRCDVPQWTLLGISLAGFNAILSLGAAVAILGLTFGSKRTEA